MLPIFHVEFNFHSCQALQLSFSLSTATISELIESIFCLKCIRLWQCSPHISLVLFLSSLLHWLWPVFDWTCSPAGRWKLVVKTCQRSFYDRCVQVSKQRSNRIYQRCRCLGLSLKWRKWIGSENMKENLTYNYKDCYMLKKFYIKTLSRCIVHMRMHKMLLNSL